jgi:hypothetical protein
MPASWTAERKAGTGTVSGTSFSFSPTATVTAGSTGLLFVFGESSTGATAASDSKSNVWTLDQSYAGGVVRPAVFSAPITSAILTSDTITVSLANLVAYAYWLEEFAGNYATVDVVVQSNGANVTSLPTGTTAATANADEIAACVYSTAATSATITKNASYTAFTTGSTAVGTAGNAMPVHRILAATGTQNADGTASAMVNSRNGIVCYKTVVATVTPPLPLYVDTAVMQSTSR